MFRDQNLALLLIKVPQSNCDFNAPNKDYIPALNTALKRQATVHKNNNK